MQAKWMRIQPPHDLRPRTEQDETSGKNPQRDRLVRPAHKFAKSVTKTNSKIQEPKIYDKAIHNLIHGNRWRKAVNKELLNLNTHQTWSNTLLPSNQKAIRCKYVFRVKYNSNGFIERYKTRLIAEEFL